MPWLPPQLYAAICPPLTPLGNWEGKADKLELQARRPAFAVVTRRCTGLFNGTVLRLWWRVMRVVFATSGDVPGFWFLPYTFWLCLVRMLDG